MESKSTHSRLFSLFLFSAVLVGVGFGVAQYFGQSRAANLTSVSVTTTNSRPSFRGALAAGNVVGTSLVNFDGTVGSYPSTSSAQIVEGDIVGIGSGANIHSYTVASTSALTVLNLTSGLLAGDADVGDDLISTQAATLNVRFTTVSAINNGSFRILVPATTGTGAGMDGIPDGGGFDYGTAAPTVTCPANLTGYTFAAGASAGEAVSLDGRTYHSYTCSYTGTGAVGTVFDDITNDMITINNVINPAPNPTHTSGTADTYPIVIQHLDNGGNVVDWTAVKVAVIEAVKVTAYVAPHISFKIIGVPSGASYCGTTTSVSTSPTNIPFGEIPIGIFKDAAQGLSIATNAVGGYVVTAAENDQLGRNGGVCAGDPDYLTNSSCIQDVRGDTGAATDTVSDEWTLDTESGFGYSLDDINGTTTEAFTYNESARTFSARQFPDLENGAAVQAIFSDTTVARNDNLYVCYRIMPDVVTAAGNYENYITYTATATF